MGPLQLACTLTLGLGWLSVATAARFDSHDPPAYDETIWTRTGGVFQLPVPRKFWSSVLKLDVPSDVSFSSLLGPYSPAFVKQMAQQRCGESC